MMTTLKVVLPGIPTRTAVFFEKSNKAIIKYTEWYNSSDKEVKSIKFKT
jgi:hypothetical protein